MKPVIALVFAGLFAVSAGAQTATDPEVPALFLPADMEDLSEFHWKKRPVRPRGFMLVLVGKDGGIKLRKPRPWDVREITRSIDKMTIRQREIREAKEKSGKIFD